MAQSSRQPSVGDKIWTVPLRVAKSGKLIGKNPLSWGDQYLKIEKINLESTIGKDLAEDIHAKSSFLIRNDDQIYAEIVQKERGTLSVRPLQKQNWPEEDSNEAESIYEETNREEGIEWEGTPQNIDSDSAKNRSKTFNESDTRGSKNDLLDGHL